MYMLNWLTKVALYNCCSWKFLIIDQQNIETYFLNILFVCIEKYRKILVARLLNCIFSSFFFIFVEIICFAISYFILKFCNNLQFRKIKQMLKMMNGGKIYSFHFSHWDLGAKSENTKKKGREEEVNFNLIFSYIRNHLEYPWHLNFISPNCNSIYFLIFNKLVRWMYLWTNSNFFIFCFWEPSLFTLSIKLIGLIICYHRS